MSQIRSFLSRRPTRATVISGTVVLALAIGGTAYAAIPNSTTGVISGCYQTLLGNLRIIDTQAGQRCNLLEKQLDWNQTGPPGPKGDMGPAGAQGPTGEPGSSAGTPVFFTEESGDSPDTAHPFKLDKAVPAGSYVVTADVQGITSGGNLSSIPQSFECFLSGAGTVPAGGLVARLKLMEKFGEPAEGFTGENTITEAFNHTGGNITLSCMAGRGHSGQVHFFATLLATKTVSVS